MDPWLVRYACSTLNETFKYNTNNLNGKLSILGDSLMGELYHVLKYSTNMELEFISLQTVPSSGKIYTILNTCKYTNVLMNVGIWYNWHINDALHI